MSKSSENTGSLERLRGPEGWRQSSSERRYDPVRGLAESRQNTVGMATNLLRISPDVYRGLQLKQKRRDLEQSVEPTEQLAVNETYSIVNNTPTTVLKAEKASDSPQLNVEAALAHVKQVYDKAGEQ